MLDQACLTIPEDLTVPVTDSPLPVSTLGLEASMQHILLAGALPEASLSEVRLSH